MTTIELGRRVIRHCKPSSLGAMTIEQGSEVTDAMSAALAEFFTYCPASKTRSSTSVHLRAPEEIEISIEQYSSDVEGYVFGDHQAGCTIEVNGHRTEIQDGNSFLDAYQGITGTYTATIYYDAVSFRDERVVRRLSHDPMLLQEGYPVRQLIRTKRDYAPSLTTETEWLNGRIWNAEQTWGDPTHYAIIETGISQNSNDWFILKIHPAPRAAYTIRFELELDPQMICWDNLTNFPIDLPVSDREFQQILIPMVEYEMMASTMWSGEPVTNQMIRDRYERARKAISTIEPDRAPNRNIMGTPHGW